MLQTPRIGPSVATFRSGVKLTKNWFREYEAPSYTTGRTFFCLFFESMGDVSVGAKSETCPSVTTTFLQGLRGRGEGQCRKLSPGYAHG